MREECDPTVRFTPRALFYEAGRPGYPDSTVESLRRDPGLPPEAVVLDAGSGTGLSAELFLRHGHTVYGVEPNPGMREAARRRLSGYAGFHSVDGRAEATGLPGASVDLVVCASAFHWFDAAAARAEFLRVLRPGGAAAILRNGRDGKGSEFMREYAALFRRHAAATGSRSGREGAVRDFFAGRPYRTEVLPWREPVDFALLRDRLLSYSTVPLPGAAGHSEMIAELREIWRRAAASGTVWYLGEVTLHAGRLE